MSITSTSGNEKMEPGSSEVEVLHQGERKLKQATLPFEIKKEPAKGSVESSKIQKLDEDCTETEVQNLELIVKKSAGKVTLESQSSSSAHNEINKLVVENASKVIDYKESDCSVYIQQNESKNIKEIVSVPDAISEEMNSKETEIVFVKEISLRNPDGSFMEDNFKSSKRKVQNEGNLIGQKPAKRVKLIYHVDKLKKCNDKVCEPEEKPVLESSVGNKVKQVSSEINSSESLNSNLVQKKCVSKKKFNDLKKLCDENCLKIESDIVGKVVVTASESCKLNAEIHTTKDLMKENHQSPVRRYTPKQLAREAEIKRRKEERELLQKEKEKKRREKEEEKVRMKRERQEVKKKIKEEKEKRRLAEIELRNEEKRKKEEERRRKEEQKLEDKRKKEEQKLEEKRKKEELQKKKEEEEILKKKFTKEAEAFSSFFKKCDVKSTATPRPEDKSYNEIVFMPFTVKADMRLAPVNRNPMDNERLLKFEELYKAQAESCNYLVELCSGIIKPKESKNTWPLEEKYDVLIDENLDLNDDIVVQSQKKFKNRRPKLLQFHENRRPPYWGTWRKKSKTIRPKRPFGKEEIFDYEVDSDDEWEEEEPGESLHGSDDEKESEDEYEVDNDFFVPHGYLSEDENPEDELISPETQKAKLKLLGEQFNLERNEKTKLLMPITVGCIWFNSDTDIPATANPSVVKLLNKRKGVVWSDEIPVPLIQDENIDPNESNLSDGGTSASKKFPFPDSAVPDLIELVHGSTSSRKTLAKTFLLDWNKKEEAKTNDNEGMVSGMLTQGRIEKKIKELCKWEEFPEEGPNYGKWCWYAKKEIREKFGVVDTPSAGKYADVLITPDYRDSDGPKKVSPPLITKFTKILTEDERRNQLKPSNRKSSPFPLPSKSESESSCPKFQIKPLSCARKLKEFWVKPSIIAKHSSGISISAPNTNQELHANSTSKDDDSDDVQYLSEKCGGGNSADGRPADAQPQNDDCEIILCSVTPTDVNRQLATEENNARRTETEENSEDFTFAVDSHCTSAKAERKTEERASKCGQEESFKESYTESDRGSTVGVAHLEIVAPADSEVVPDVTADDSFSEPLCKKRKECESGSSDVPIGTSTGEILENRAVAVNESKPGVVKKRVPILLSVPRGCEIVKPSVVPATRKKMTLDEVVKKYEKENSK